VRSRSTAAGERPSQVNQDQEGEHKRPAQAAADDDLNVLADLGFVMRPCLKPRPWTAA